MNSPSAQPNRKFSATEEVRQKIVVGVAGGSAAGKTTLCENINRQMAFDRNFKVETISLDSFYKSISFTIKMWTNRKSISPSTTSITPMHLTSTWPTKPL